jgi:hypothetical protein
MNVKRRINFLLGPWEINELEIKNDSVFDAMWKKINYSEAVFIFDIDGCIKKLRVDNLLEGKPKWIVQNHLREQDSPPKGNCFFLFTDKTRLFISGGDTTE